MRYRGRGSKLTRIRELSFEPAPFTVDPSKLYAIDEKI
jgi:hypothetical protein